VLITPKEQIMEYVILNTQPIINGETTSNFINILDITGNTCNVTISNREATIHTVTITSDVETNINEYFNSISDKE
jgi:hypothetical protein